MVTTQIQQQYRVMVLNTTIISTATGGSSYCTTIPVQSLGEGTGKFTIGDLIAVGPLTSFTGKLVRLNS